MLSDISEQLAQVMERKSLKERLRRNLSQVERDLEQKSRLLDELEQRLHKEQVDMENLERLSLTGLFYTILGSRDQQEEKERQELLAAQLKYQQAKRSVDLLRTDQGHLEQQLGELRDVEDEYAFLFARKESLLRQANPQVAQDLVRLDGQIAERNAEKKEIDEAIIAASGVLAGLDQVIASLESAEGWGNWDMLGGGLLSTAVKHSRIDDARAAVENVQEQMSRFTRELADVQRGASLSINIGGLDTFADYFFDGLITDWIVQSKIKDSLEQSRLVRVQISRVTNDLEKLRDEAIRQAERLNGQRNEIVYG